MTNTVVTLVAGQTAMIILGQVVMPESAFQYVIQGGFAAFSLALLWVLWALVQKLLLVLKETNMVISANTAVIEKLRTTAGDSQNTLEDIRDRLLERPCLLPKRDR